MITYKKATIDDVAQLAHVRCEFLAIVNSLPPAETLHLEQACIDYFDRTIANDTFVAYMAYDGDSVVATSGINFYHVPPNMTSPNGHMAYIQNMYTRDTHRRRGIANRLFELLIEEAKSRSCPKITLNATHLGRPLYESFGFVPLEDEMVHYCK